MSYTRGIEAATFLHVDKGAGWPAYLAEAMRRAALTQAQLARATGIPDAVVSRWLRGETQPTVSNLRRLAGPLGVPLLDLLVAAGHLDATEARIRNRPALPARASQDPLDQLLDELLDSEPSERRRELMRSLIERERRNRDDRVRDLRETWQAMHGEETA